MNITRVGVDLVKLVSAVRQNQKTDKNDSLVIIQASLVPEVNFIDGKNTKQQQLQSIKRLRELAVKQRDAIQKQVIALLLELNIRCPNKSASLLKLISDVLEDGENNLLFEFRQALETAKITLTTLIESVSAYGQLRSINRTAIVITFNEPDPAGPVGVSELDPGFAVK
jgi:transposase